MLLEQKSIDRDPSPIRSRLKTASVAEIADFFKRAVEEEHLKSPELSPYWLFKSVAAANLPLRIHNCVRQRALEAMTSKDADEKLAGKSVFLWLSIRSIFTAVDSVFVRGEDTDQDREEMFSSAIISVMENAPKLIKECQISAKIIRHVGKSAKPNVKPLAGTKKSYTDDGCGNIELKIDIAEAVNTLPSRQIAALRRLYGLDGGGKGTTKHVSKELGITGSAVHARANKGYDLLRHHPYGSKLRGYY